jgi:hypothetical protein
MFLDLPDPHPDPLDRGTDPRIRIRIRIRIRTKMSRIHNTAIFVVKFMKVGVVKERMFIPRTLKKWLNYTVQLGTGTVVI